MTKPRHDWTRAEILALHARPLNDLIVEAQAALRAHHDPNAVQRSRLLNIKTGGCAENCGYCSQSAFVETGLLASKLMPLDEVLAAARRAKADGAERFCMGPLYRLHHRTRLQLTLRSWLVVRKEVST